MVRKIQDCSSTQNRPKKLLSNQVAEPLRDPPETTAPKNNRTTGHQAPTDIIKASLLRHRSSQALPASAAPSSTARPSPPPSVPINLPILALHSLRKRLGASPLRLPLSFSPSRNYHFRRARMRPEDGSVFPASWSGPAVPSPSGARGREVVHPPPPGHPRARRQLVCAPRRVSLCLSELVEREQERGGRSGGGRRGQGERGGPRSRGGTPFASSRGGARQGSIPEREAAAGAPWSQPTPALGAPQIDGPERGSADPQRQPTSARVRHGIIACLRAPPRTLLSRPFRGGKVHCSTYPGRTVLDRGACAS